MSAALPLIAILSLTFVAPAAAQDDATATPAVRLAAAPERPATVSFLDDQPFTKTWDQLTAADGLAVTVRNEGRRRQHVTLFVLGAPRLRRMDAEIDPRAVRRLLVPLSNAQPPRDGSYGAVVVASGERGAVVRRRFTLTVDEVPAPARGRVLTAADLADQTLPATNFAPSLLDPWGPASLVLALGGLLFLIIALWGRRTDEEKRWDRIAGLAVLVILVAGFLGVVGRTFFSRDDQQGLSRVSAKSLPVSGVGDGTYGVVTNDEADIGSLVVEANRLTVEGLGRAGAYSGKLDLTPGVEKGDATVKVNVRDWWLWPFLVIGAGVLVGYRVRRFFQRSLPRDQLIAQAYRMEAEATKTIPEIPPYSMERPLADEIKRIVALARRDLTGATTALATLRTNLDAYSRMALVLTALHRRLAEVKARANLADVPQLGERLEKAEALLEKPLVAFDKTEYDGRVELAGVAEQDLDAVIGDDNSVRSLLVQAAAMKSGAAPALRRKLEAIEVRLHRLRREVFLSDATSVDAAISACRTELLDLAGQERLAIESRSEDGEAAGATVASAAEGAVPLPDYAAQAEQGVRDAERRGSLVAGTLAVASGLSTLYFADGVWGTPGDYLAALVWGAAVAEGLKYVKAIADRNWAE